jgi:hypothetical protein
MHDSTEALPSREVESRAARHVTTLEPSLTERRDPKPHDV